MAPITRRQLVRGTAAAAAAASLTSLHTVRRTRPGSPSEELRVAVVGLRGRGRSHIDGFQGIDGVEVVALVDVDADVLAQRKGELEKRRGEKVDGYKDIREVLDREDVDIVSIATPNHLHALQTIWSCQAGKDVYVEKPVCHNVFEGRQMVRAAEKYGRLVQTGTQSRSSHGIRAGIEWIQAGGLGEIRYAHGTCFKPRKSIGKVDRPTPIPESVDWDLYCGPAPKGPLMRKQLHYDWHWQFATGNGDLGNQGIHQMDTCRWGIGAGALAPGVVSVGGRFGYDDDGDTPNTLVTLLAYEPAPILFEVRGLPRDRAAQEEDWGGRMDRNEGWTIGSTIYCEHGRLVIPNSNDKTIAYDEDGQEIRRWEGATSHFANFVEALRARDGGRLNAPILEGHLSSSLCHLGNDSLLVGERAHPDEIRRRLGDHPIGSSAFGRLHGHLQRNGVDLEQDMAAIGPFLTFDTAAEQFTNHRRANTLLTRPYRAPFVVPVEV